MCTMAIVNVYQAKTGFSKLLARVAAGEEIIIARANRPVAKLVPLDDAPQRRVPDKYRGEIRIAENFDDDLSEDMLGDFEKGDLL